MMGDGGVKQMLAKPIQLADMIIKWADEAQSFRQECLELKSKTERLAGLLRQAARADLYERPARRIMIDTEKQLDRVLMHVSKCRGGGIMKRVFTIIPAGSFKKMSNLLDSSIGDVSWLLRVSTASGDEDGDAHLGLPPIAQNEPILFLIWEQIANLQTGSLESRADAAASLVSLARDSERYGKMIIEEDGVVPLLRLVKEGRVEGQENAALALGLLGRDPESVDQMVLAGICTAFAKVLKEGSMKVQAMVAWAVSELAANHPKCQEDFKLNNVIRLLTGHLAFETVEEHSRYSVMSTKTLSIHSVVMDNKNIQKNAKSGTQNGMGDLIDVSEQCMMKRPNGNHSQASQNQMHSVIQSTMHTKSNKPGVGMGTSSVASTSGSSGLNGSISSVGLKGRELEAPETKAYMKAMAARAMGQLAKGNREICRSITESKGLLCLAILLEKGDPDVRYNSALALMEICHVAEEDEILRHSAFKPGQVACKFVVNNLLQIVEKGDNDDLLVPCIVCLGCLSRTFRASETRVIGPLVNLLDESEGEVSKEAVVALTKYAETKNYLHVEHSRAIINVGGAKHLAQLVYFGEQVVQIAALILVCYIAQHVPDSEELAKAEILTLLEWASKHAYMTQDGTVEELLPEAKVRLELYQSRGTRSYH